MPDVKLSEELMTARLEEEFKAEFFDPGKMKIFVNPHGLTCLEYGDRVYWKISVRCALPHQAREEYLFFYNYSDTEIGAVRRLGDLPRETRKQVEELLARRYFTRAIEEVHSVTDRFSVLIFKVRTDTRSTIEFTVVRPKDCISRSRSGGFLITDVDNNMYYIPTRKILACRDLIMIERYC